MKKLLEYVAKGKFYESVVEDGSDIILIVTYEGVILYHNDAVEEVLGYKSGSLLNKNLFDYINPMTLPAFRKRFAESVKKPYDEAVEFEFICSNKSPKYLEFNSINLNQKEQLDGLILDCRDISERKRDAAELVRAQKAKEQFLANISHEIRTPINGIAGMAELLSQDPSEEDKVTYLNAIRSAADNLKVIINDILDLASIESGKLKFENIGFNPKDLLSSLIGTFAVQAREKGIGLRLNVDEDANTILVGDPVRLNQILINLIANALKFTPQGHIQIDCLVEKKHRRKFDMLFRVSDTGIGIPKDKLKTIFESFSQADESVTRKFGGTGLGLTIVRQLAELQHGKVDVKSTEDQGSIFSVHIPYAIGSADDIAESAKSPMISSHRRSLADMHVLLVEDNDINRLYASSILKSWDCTLETAENGYVALEKIKNNDFDVILMDIQMPVMDGFEATKAIRMGEGGTSKVPIIALTANATRKDIERCLDAGMNDCIPKPFAPEDLFRALFKYSNSSSGAEEAREVLTSMVRNGKKIQAESVDLSYLRKVTSNNDEFMQDMIRTFLESMPRSVEEIRTAAQAKDWENVARAIHKIKPSLTMMGLAKTREMAADIEANAKAGNTSRKLTQSTETFCQQVESALQDLSNLQG